MPLSNESLLQALQAATKTHKIADIAQRSGIAEETLRAIVAAQIGANASDKQKLQTTLNELNQLDIAN